jgi:hypothetical protein
MAALLTGCAAAGVQVTDQQAQSFQVGRATYADVVAQLGQPTTVSTSTNGRRVAVYSYAAMSRLGRRISFRISARLSPATTQSPAP